MPPVSFISSNLGRQGQFMDSAPIKVLFPEGRYRAVVTAPQGYTITSILRGSLDLMKEPLTIPSDNTSDIVVTISRRNP